MSLDVTLYSERKIKQLCHHCGSTYYEREELFTANITHNLGRMADACGIYEACWRPENINARTARDIIDLLENGLEELKGNPEYYKKFNSSNGWGLYENFVPWVEKYLNACKAYPESIIKVSR